MRGIWYLGYLVARSLAESITGSKSPRRNSPCSACHRGRENARQEALDCVVSTAGRPKEGQPGREAMTLEHCGRERVAFRCQTHARSVFLEELGMEKQESRFGTGFRIDRLARERVSNRVVWQP